MIILNTKKSLHIKSELSMKPRTLQKVCVGGWWWWLRVILVLSFKPSLTIITEGNKNWWNNIDPWGHGIRVQMFLGQMSL